MNKKNYMPQIRDTFGVWSDIWFAPLFYADAKNVREQIIHSGIDYDRTRIIRVVA